MPILSFIVPVYNVETYLVRCLDSLLGQDFSDFEVVAVDDGSTDKSGEILEDYRRRYGEKLFVFSKENGGLSDARNFGLARARGKYVAFVDSDDYLLPDFAALTVEKMEQENLDLLLYDFFYEYPDGKRICGNVKKLCGSELSREVMVSAAAACFRVYRRTLLGEAPFRRGIYYEDLELTPRLLLRTERIGFLPKALYGYVQRDGSIMNESRFSPRWTDIFPVLESLREAFSREERGKEFALELEFLHIEHLLRSAALRFCDSKEGRRLFPRLGKTVKEHFPHWKKNPYLKQSSFPFRLTVWLSASGCFRLLSLLKKWKG